MKDRKNSIMAIIAKFEWNYAGDMDRDKECIWPKTTLRT